MNEVKRLGYKSQTSNQLVEVEFKYGSLVRYEDYEKLEKENAKLKEILKPIEIKSSPLLEEELEELRIIEEEDNGDLPPETPIPPGGTKIDNGGCSAIVTIAAIAIELAAAAFWFYILVDPTPIIHPTPVFIIRMLLIVPKFVLYTLLDEVYTKLIVGIDDILFDSRD